jgi:DNA-binding IclR family transcriptional regulator
MGRKPGFDTAKINVIITALYENQEGLWIRRLAKVTGLHPSTVTKYVEGAISSLVDVRVLGEKPMLKVVSLKPIVLQKLEEGQKIGDILKYLKMINRALE